PAVRFTCGLDGDPPAAAAEVGRKHLPGVLPRGDGQLLDERRQSFQRPRLQVQPTRLRLQAYQGCLTRRRIGLYLPLFLRRFDLEDSPAGLAQALTDLLPARDARQVTLAGKADDAVSQDEPGVSLAEDSIPARWSNSVRHRHPLVRGGLHPGEQRVVDQ